MRERDWQADVALGQEREGKARAILAVPGTAGLREIRRAFRRASLKVHPDTNGSDPGAARQFRLVCCAYKFLIEGQACRELDEMPAPPPAVTDGTYRRDNAWGYWCWWRESFFDL